MYTHKTLTRWEFLQNILKSKAVMGESKRHTAAIQELRIHLSPEWGFSRFARQPEFHTEGHRSSLNCQLTSLCVATLMLFKQFSFNAQTVNCSPLNRLLFDKSTFLQIWSSTNRATIVPCSAIINRVVHLSNATHTDTRKEKKMRTKNLGSYSSEH